MFESILPLATTATAWTNQALLAFAPLLAQAEEEEGRPYNLEVFLIMLCIILGLMITMRTSKRTAEVEKLAPETDD